MVAVRKGTLCAQGHISNFIGEKMSVGDLNINIRKVSFDSFSALHNNNNWAIADGSLADTHG
jgi:hypothetical protein